MEGCVEGCTEGCTRVTWKVDHKGAQRVVWNVT